MRKFVTKNIQFFLIAILFVFAACDKNSNDPENLPVDGKYVINVTISGIEDLKFEKSSLNNQNKSFQKIASTQKIFDNKNYEEWITSTSPTLHALSSISEYKGSEIDNHEKLANVGPINNNETNKLSVTSLGPTKKYRILIFNEQNVLMNPSNTEFTVGTPINIAVDAMKSYTWYAYSTDETSTPAFNPSTYVIDKTALAGKNVLYAKSASPITMNEGINYLNVVFKHHRVRYDVVIDTRGLFAKMNDNTTVDVGYYNAEFATNPVFTTMTSNGDLDIKAGTYINNENITVGSLYRKDTITTDGTVRKFTIYSTNTSTIPANRLALRFPTLSLTDLSTSTPYNINGQGLVFTNNTTAITPAYNKYYELTARLSSGTAVGGIVWASGNLRYLAGNTYPYQFRTANEYDPDINTDYFNWRSATSAPDAAVNVADPCNSVLPLGTWRLPTVAEYDALKTTYSNIENKQYDSGLFSGTRMVLRVILPQANIFAAQADPLITRFGPGLYFNYGGYRYKTIFNEYDVSGKPAALLLGLFAAGSAEYWTSNDYPSLTGYAYYYRSSVTTLGLSFSGFSSSNAQRIEGRSVRCVRPA